MRESHNTSVKVSKAHAISGYPALRDSR